MSWRNLTAAFLGILTGVALVIFTWTWSQSAILPGAQAGVDRLQDSATNQQRDPHASPSSSMDLPGTPEPSSREPGETSLTLGEVRASALPSAAKKLFDCANRVLRAAGDAEISSDYIISENDIKGFVAICTADNDAIRDADKAIREIQDAYVPDMAKTIMESVAAGKTPPYDNITDGGLPRQPRFYDRFVTSSYQGSTYLLTLPYTPELMNRVDHLRAAQELRLSNIRFVIRPLFRRR